MIHLQGKLLRGVVLACSGGVDSMAALDFLLRNHRVTVAYFNHKTEHGAAASTWLREQCRTKYPNVKYRESTIQGTCPKGLSKEEWWRKERYEWLTTTFYGEQIITAHHLDDAVETWIWSSLHGTPKLLPYAYDNVIRPFRLNRKRDLELWAKINNVDYIDDPSNTDTSYTRNYIRHEMMPHVLKVNPGIHKLVRKKLVEQFERNDLVRH